MDLYSWQEKLLLDPDFRPALPAPRNGKTEMRAEIICARIQAEIDRALYTPNPIAADQPDHWQGWED